MRYETKNANRYICTIGTNIAAYAYILNYAITAVRSFIELQIGYNPTATLLP
jgi:hypothetical protein